MGTRFELVLADQGDPAPLRALGEAALDEIRIAHDLLNRFAPGGLPGRLAMTPAGTPIPLDRECFALFQDARLVWQQSAGAFDPALGTGFDALTLDSNRQTVTATRFGVMLDFGGIAKGHALDQAAAVLRAGGVENAFLHGGTSSALGIGHPPDRDGWMVRVARVGSTASARDVEASVVLTDRAMSVSAAWVDNPHPTLDPRTGEPVPVPRRAVVLGPAARLADAWSTVALVLGRRPDNLTADWEVLVTA
jgi:thiamine biosynthesis lipoprotein